MKWQQEDRDIFHQTGDPLRVVKRLLEGLDGSSNRAEIYNMVLFFNLMGIVSFEGS